MSYFDSDVDVYPSVATPERSICVYTWDGIKAASAYLTPAEARELANRLLKEAAEVEFATKCNQAVQG